MPVIRAYLRASTPEQDATRATDELKSFTQRFNRTITHWYYENASGTLLERPELNKLLDEAQPGDFLLLEKVDRISRLSESDWLELRKRISKAGVTLVVVGLPTTHNALINNEDSQIWRERIFTEYMNNLMIDLAAEMARDDYETRRHRQKQGIAKAKAKGAYRGKQRTQATIDKYLKAVKLVTVNRITVRDACKAAKISPDTYYKIRNEKLSPEKKPSVSGSERVKKQ